MRGAEEFFDGMGPFAWRIDPVTNEFSAWVVDVVGLDQAPAREGAKPRSAGAGHAAGSRSVRNRRPWITSRWIARARRWELQCKECGASWTTYNRRGLRPARDQHKCPGGSGS